MVSLLGSGAQLIQGTMNPKDMLIFFPHPPQLSYCVQINAQSYSNDIMIQSNQ